MKYGTLALVLGAMLCAGSPALAMGGTAVGPHAHYPSYTPTILNYVSTRGGMLVEVRGSPFDQVSEDELARQIAATMERSHFGPEVSFIATAPDGYASPYRVVVVFDPVVTLTDFRVCRYGEDVTNGGAAEVLHVQAVLCGGEKPVTSISGRTGSAASPSDPGFRQLMGQMAHSLFPPRRPDGGRRGQGTFTN